MLRGTTARRTTRRPPGSPAKGFHQRGQLTIMGQPVLSRISRFLATPRSRRHRSSRGSTHSIPPSWRPFAPTSRSIGDDGLFSLGSTSWSARETQLRAPMGAVLIHLATSDELPGLAFALESARDETGHRRGSALRIHRLGSSEVSASALLDARDLRTIVASDAEDVIGF